MAKGYNPNQPRHPKGSEDGGEWRGSGTAGPSVADVKKTVEDRASRPVKPLTGPGSYQDDIYKARMARLRGGSPGG